MDNVVIQIFCRVVLCNEGCCLRVGSLYVIAPKMKIDKNLFPVLLTICVQNIVINSSSYVIAPSLE